jgi:hypothetical protein
VHRDPLARARALRRRLALAALATALAAAPAAAQPRKDVAAKARVAPAASSTAPALAAPAPSQVPLPPAPSPTSFEPRRVGWLAVSAGAWAGLDSGQGGAVQLDYGVVRTPAGWTRLQLEVRLAATVARPTDSTDLTTVIPTYGGPVEIPSGNEKMSAWIVEIVRNYYRCQRKNSDRSDTGGIFNKCFAFSSFQHRFELCPWG